MKRESETGWDKRWGVKRGSSETRGEGGEGLQRQAGVWGGGGKERVFRDRLG